MKLPINIVAVISKKLYSILTDYLHICGMDEGRPDMEMDFLLVEAAMTKQVELDFSCLDADIPTVLWYTDNNADLDKDWEIIDKFDYIILSEASSLKQFISKLEPLGKKVGLVPMGFNPLINNPTVSRNQKKGVVHYSPKKEYIFDNNSLFGKYSRGALYSFLAHDFHFAVNDDVISCYPKFIDKFKISSAQFINTYNRSKFVSFFEGSPDSKTFIPNTILEAIAENKTVSVVNSGSVKTMFGMLIYSGISQEETAYWLDSVNNNISWAKRINSQAIRRVMTHYSSPAIIKSLYSLVKGNSEFAENKVTVISVCQTHKELDRILGYYDNQKYTNKQLIVFCRPTLYDQINKMKVNQKVEFYPINQLKQYILGEIISTEYFTYFDPINVYGNEFLNDLMLSRYYGVMDGYVKAQSINVIGQSVSEDYSIEYRIIHSSVLGNGIFKTAVFKGVNLLELPTLKVEGRFQTLDGQQIIYNGSSLDTKILNRLLDTSESDDLPEFDSILESYRNRKGTTNSPDDLLIDTIQFPLDSYLLDDTNASFNQFGNTLECKSTSLDVQYICPKDFQATNFAIAPSNIPQKYKWISSKAITYLLSVEGEVFGEIDASVMFVFYDNKKQLRSYQVGVNKSLCIEVPATAVFGVPLIRIKGEGECHFSKIKVGARHYINIPITWFEDSHDNVKVSENSLEFFSELKDKEHIYLRPEGYKNGKFSDPPSEDFFSTIERGSYYGINIEGSVEAELNIDFIFLYYDKNSQIGRSRFTVNQPSTFCVEAGVKKIVPVIRVSGKGKFSINNITIRKAEQMFNLINTKQHTGERYLLVTNNYPNDNDYYANMFVHRRVISYINNNLNIVVFKQVNQRAGNLSNYSFDGVNVFTGNAEDLSDLIKIFDPQKILVHFISKAMIDVFARLSLDISILVWLHGAEVYPISSRLSNYLNYNKASIDLNSSIQRVGAMASIFEKRDNYRFILVSESFRRDIQNDYGISLESNLNPTIHNYIDTEIFQYMRKPAHLRKNIVSVKSYKTRIYAGDLLVKVVEELSKKPFFEDLTFSFYGQGQLFYNSLGSLTKYSNVRIYNKFLSPNELALLYQRNGIVLIPTRHDTHGVSRDEAMACGLVPITSDIACVPEFVDADCGILTPPEDVIAMAEAIELLYYDPDLYLKLSENAADRVRQQCGYEQTIKREIELITSSR
ncbi:glycosyltransferase family 4 protein [Paenibacillus lautus]|uniref:glycosyltransferase family 4 protein n=1 Tax=Paenibacillus lautus TaxID=1401 RepID=UPI002DB8A6D2|nr:glycosyltransferase family 4 protein [Paenibacillus lautus]MEC0258397.1 glycosyltransferase family 4 protein [Paenibacillus lautus]